MAVDVGCLGTKQNELLPKRVDHRLLAESLPQWEGVKEQGPREYDHHWWRAHVLFIPHLKSAQAFIFHLCIHATF